LEDQRDLEDSADQTRRERPGKWWVNLDETLNRSGVPYV
jgi:hypothetical protein